VVWGCSSLWKTSKAYSGVGQAAEKEIQKPA